MPRLQKEKNMTEQIAAHRAAADPATLEAKLADFLKKLDTPERLTVADIKDIVWNETESNVISRLAFFILEGKKEKEGQSALNLLSEAWNFFPHQSLNGLSPNEMVERGLSRQGKDSPSHRDRRTFFEIFSGRFPKHVGMVHAGQHEWEFEFPAMIQDLRVSLRDLDELDAKLGDEGDDFDPALALNYAQIMNIIERSVLKEPLFFDGVIRMAQDEFARGDAKKAKQLFEKSITAGRAVFPKNFVRGKDTLPWGRLDNRPFLLLLGEYATLVETIDGTAQAIPHYEELLALNPNDNQGIRMYLATAYLATEQLEKLCTLSEKYPDDMMQEIVVSHILALYKLGKHVEATKKIHDNEKSSGHVFREILTTKEHVKPELMPGRVRMGGDDEAWLYWQAQGIYWMTTPGAREFLKNTLESAVD